MCKSFTQLQMVEELMALGKKLNKITADSSLSGEKQQNPLTLLVENVVLISTGTPSMG